MVNDIINNTVYNNYGVSHCCDDLFKYTSMQHMQFKCCVFKLLVRTKRKLCFVELLMYLF